MSRVKLSVAAVLFVFACVSCAAYAQDQVETAKDWKKEVRADKAKIAEQKKEIKANATAAHAEEKQLRGQIRAARASGDEATAKQLEAQLKATHAENVQEMKSDKKELQDAKRELKHDAKPPRKPHYALPKKADIDNNPPGPKGGPGTNWENPPGPKGGPGASPNRGRGRR
jgi:peptidoglycan hydrolase CwlO-like protein